MEGTRWAQYNRRIVPLWASAFSPYGSISSRSWGMHDLRLPQVYVEAIRFREGSIMICKHCKREKTVIVRRCPVCGVEFESEDGLVSCPAHSFGERDPNYAEAQPCGHTSDWWKNFERCACCGAEYDEAEMLRLAGEK